MACKGFVKNGHMELEPGFSIAEGTVVRVEVLDVRSSVSGEDGPMPAGPRKREELLAQWADPARRVAEVSPGPRSIVDELIESRR
jgi:hypothetical protein